MTAVPVPVPFRWHPVDIDWTDGGRVTRTRHMTVKWTAVPVRRYGAQPYVVVVSSFLKHL